MITINRIRQLRDNPDNLMIDLSNEKMKSLDNDIRNFYIVLKQFENTFNSYKLQELINFTGYGKKNIINLINQLDSKNIIDKATLKLKGVEVD